MKKKLCFFGLLTGLINAAFGAGGGIVCVSLLKKMGIEQKRAQATTVCVILPLTVITSTFYLLKGYLSLSDSFIYILPGFFGSVLGSLILKKINNDFLGKLFSLFMIWAGLRMIFR
ncbi:MAG: sulfite exporter TauE/SafE family protein [Clostridia bacterium]|nr:sulfite exporter TauE/SafE family protein [Clostridia bacterium]